MRLRPTAGRHGRLHGGVLQQGDFRGVHQAHVRAGGQGCVRKPGKRVVCIVRVVVAWLFPEACASLFCVRIGAPVGKTWVVLLGQLEDGLATTNQCTCAVHTMRSCTTARALLLYVAFSPSPPNGVFLPSAVFSRGELGGGT